MADEITADLIAENANKPASAALEGQSASQHSIADQILALQQQQTAKAVAKTGSAWGSLRIVQAQPPGTQE
ncbi:hypothetical protein EBZ38_08885 [bacterium]|nr:hypothetical protein [bacterium]NDD84369.1 hypothetical protein [bacterium]NDG19009.1 hypothetical protein [Betaproteobacteria bacterium]